MKNQFNRIKHSNLARTGLFIGFTAFATHITSATVIATDGDITANISSPHGTPNDWAEHILGYSGKYDLMLNREVTVGKFASWNALTVRNGSVLTVITKDPYDHDFLIGWSDQSISSDNNKVVVTGAGSAIKVERGDVYVGYGESSNNSLRVENGGRLEASYWIVVGNGIDSNNNELIVTGSGSTARTMTRIHIGYDGSSNNSLRVENGGRLETSDLIAIGSGRSDSNNNELIATGSGTEVKADVYLSWPGGSGDRYVLSNGALHYGNVDVIGSDSEFLITGQGTYMNGEIDISSESGSLKIADGAKVDLLWTTSILGHNNRVSILGTGTEVTSGEGSSLTVTLWDSNNSLNVSDGAYVWAAMLVVEGSQQQVKINDQGTVFRAGSGLPISVRNSGLKISGRDSEVLVTDGARVIADQVVWGSSISSPEHNSVTVTGKNSRLDISHFLEFEHNSVGNVLMVSDGALVTIGGDITFSTAVESIDNYLRLNGGFFAWKGERTEDANQLLEDERIQVWNIAAQAWESALTSERFEMHYFETNEEAFAYTGYDNLGGYTILGTGAVPEPGTYAAIVSLLTAGLVVGMKRRNRVK